MTAAVDGAGAAPALETSGLGRSYRRTWALRDCTLAIPRGRIVAVVGANGAGKTTLLHLAMGLLTPSEGTVRVFGEPVSAGADMPRVGFVAQDRPLYTSFTVADTLHYGRSMNPRWDQEFALERMDQLQIPLKRRVSRLSGGQRAQMALTLALAKRPDLLVLDEPVASLDPLARRDFMRVMVDAVAGEGLTVLLSSHVVAELERLCDYLVLLRDGQVRLCGDIDEIVDSHRLLTGPRGDVPADLAGVVAVTHGARHSNVLTRTPDGVTPHPRWESHPVDLEELVLAYLEKPQPAAASAPAVGASERA